MTASPITYIRLIPILTTVLSVLFGTQVLRRFRDKPGSLHLAWWATGIYVYGIGTLSESVVTLAGWSAVAFRLWYVTGALLGGVLLAQGSVYLHLSRRTAHRLTAVVVPYLMIASVLVAVVPIDPSLADPHGLSGKVIQWHWVRLLSPPINLYAATFLIGGALVSAIRYARRAGAGRLAAGNALIAVGAILPGVGGTYARLGHTEVLYVLEFIGLILIGRGYRLCIDR